MSKLNIIIIGGNVMLCKRQQAINMAIYAHRGQYDKGNIPYVNHPIFIALGMSTEEEQIVALLHDVVEDSNKYTIDDIRNIFGDTIADAVDCITKRKDSDENYVEYLKRVRTNPIALKVKMADINHNLMGDRIPVKDKKYFEMSDKYKQALWYLQMPE
jgi:(p)ppGpp synthase/HD superfamily hydrolase